MRLSADELRQSAEDRFLARVIIEPNSYCWLWAGSLSPKGYARFSVGRGPVIGSRFAFEHFRGPIPPGMFVCHRCDVRCCVNPDHLFLGTHDDNMRDMCTKGRSARGVRPSATRLSEADVMNVHQLIAQGRSQASIARQYDVSPGTINHIHLGRTWGDLLPAPSDLTAPRNPSKTGDPSRSDTRHTERGRS